MKGRAAKLLWFGLLAGCRPAPAAVEPGPAVVDVPRDRPEPARAEPPGRCAPPLPAAEGPAPAEGPAWLLVEDVGVLRIAGGEVSTLAPPERGESRWGAAMLATAGGELWLADWKGLLRIGAGGEVRRVVEGGSPGALALRGAELWAVTGDIEWRVERLEGSRLRAVRRRGEFRGTYEDNKFVALAAAEGALWVSSWNGLWRGGEGAWQKVEPGDPEGRMLDLWVYRGRLITGDPSGSYHMSDGSGWRALNWRREADVRRAVSDVGLVAAPTRRGAEVRIASIEGEGCAATSEGVPGAYVHDLAIDGSGRVWVASDRGLAVLGRDGRALGTWTEGQLPGLSGRILRVAVSGAGPGRLPAVQTARTREVSGRLTLYKNGSPLAGAEVELCSAVTGEERCPDSAFVRRATSGADGGFRFCEVPDGEFRLLVRPPHDTEACRSPFTVKGGSVEPARDCPASGACDLGEVEQCLPFEMPPPPSRHGGSH